MYELFLKTKYHPHSKNPAEWEAKYLSLFSIHWGFIRVLPRENPFFTDMWFQSNRMGDFHLFKDTVQ